MTQSVVVMYHHRMIVPVTTVLKKNIGFSNYCTVCILLRKDRTYCTCTLCHDCVQWWCIISDSPVRTVYCTWCVCYCNVVLYSTVYVRVVIYCTVYCISRAIPSTGSDGSFCTKTSKHAVSTVRCTALARLYKLNFFSVTIISLIASSVESYFSRRIFILIFLWSWVGKVTSIPIYWAPER